MGARDAASEIVRTAPPEIRCSPSTDPASMSAAEPTVITPEGELDIASLGDLCAAISDAAHEGAGTVVVDLSQVTFIDSSGLGALVELRSRLRRSGRRLAVVAQAVGRQLCSWISPGSKVGVAVPRCF